MSKSRSFIWMLLLPAILLNSSTGCSSLTDLFSERDLTRIPLDQALNNGQPTLVDFGWRDCEPCKKMKAVLASLASKYRGRMNVVMVEAYNHRDLMKTYGINAIPVQIIFDINGQELTRHQGFWSEEDITAELTKAGIN
jgi:thioredoxin-like negative regulator of GroEL